MQDNPQCTLYCRPQGRASQLAKVTRACNWTPQRVLSCLSRLCASACQSSLWASACLSSLCASACLSCLPACRACLPLPACLCRPVKPACLPGTSSVKHVLCTGGLAACCVCCSGVCRHKSWSSLQALRKPWRITHERFWMCWRRITACTPAW